MEKLEKQQKELHDQYNQENNEWNGYEYVRKLRQASNLVYAIGTHEKLKDYFVKLQIHVDLATKKNADTHIWNNGRGCWFTHEDKFGKGCFMCEDVNLISYLMSLVGYFAHKYPDEKVIL